MSDEQYELVVIGGGPGGYSAAFRAADLGKKVALIEKRETLGGVCLNVGCIPSKTLLHAANLIDEMGEMDEFGVSVTGVKVDVNKLRDKKSQVVQKLTGGLSMLAKQRKVTVINGEAVFASDKTITVGKKTIGFDQCIIAAGSRPVSLPFIPEDPRIMTSTEALELEEPKANLLVIGGGIIGLEMATVYRALGAKIDVVEFMPQIIPGADKDIVAPLAKRMTKQGVNFMLETKVTKVDAKKDGIHVTFEGKNAPAKAVKYSRVLVAVGRAPNGALIGADAAGVKVDERGFIAVDKQMRTNVPHIFAVGDVVGNPMLAHKAIHEAHVAAEVVAGEKHFFEPRCIPGVAYTDPEIAWVGLTETDAKAKGVDYDKGVFPWMANGRALSQGRDEGMTKVIFDKKTNQILGCGIVGPGAGELIAEATLAIEMGCDAEDIALTIHPHPTVSESVGLATEMFTGSITDLISPKLKKKAKKA
jgi:dihydrolipoamide dehydrogenase